MCLDGELITSVIKQPEEFFMPRASQELFLSNVVCHLNDAEANNEECCVWCFWTQDALALAIILSKQDLGK